MMSFSSRPARSSPATATFIEGVASVNEFGDHRRIRARDPRSRGRSVGGDRRHDGSFRFHQGEDHRRARLDLHRSDDRSRRRRGAAEDAERTGAVDPAVRPDPDLPDRLRDALADRQIFRDRAVGDRADRAARLPHSDDHRRPPVRDRHRRHGPADPLQRHRHLGALGRGGGRRRHALARQDRHDHLRQPHGHRVPAGRRRPARSPRRSRPRLEPRRRDAGRPLHRGARQGRITVCRNPTSIPPKPRSCPSPPRPAFPASMSAPAPSAKARSIRSCVISRSRSRTRRTSSARRSNGWPRRAARRSRWPTGAGSSASSI